MQKFKDHCELYEWARLQGEESGFIITTAKSDFGKKKFLTLGCARSGKYKEYKGQKTDRKSRSNKCNCPFKLRGRPHISEGNCWYLKVMSGRHNHAISKSALSQKRLGKDKVEQRERAPSKEEQSLELKLKSALEGVSLKLEQADVRTKKKILETLEELAFPEQNDMRLLDQLPTIFQPYVRDIKNVTGDGNCGFRVVAQFLDMGQDAWPEIRKSMIVEMQTRAIKYQDLFGNDLFSKVMNALEVKPQGLVMKEKWFTIPQMGAIAATAFQIVLITLGKRGCTTYLPFAGAPPSQPKMLVLGHIDENHWVQVLIYTALIPIVF